MTRRRRRRNPGVGSIIGQQLEGLKTGVAVVAGQVASRKICGAVNGMAPASLQAQLASGIGQLALKAIAAAGTSYVASRFVPGSARRYAPFIAAGAWSEVINAGLAQTPIAPYLSAFPVRRPTMRALPGQASSVARGRVAAYPGTGLPAGTVSAYPLSAYPTMRSVGMPSHVGS